MLPRALRGGVEHPSPGQLVQDPGHGLERVCEQRWRQPGKVAAGSSDGLAVHRALAQTQEAYRCLRERGIKKEDARFLLPNAAATRMIMTANFRELLHMFRIRIAPDAQWEVCQVCVRMLEAVYPHAPSVFGAIRDRLRKTYPSFFDGPSAAEVAR